MDRSPVIRPRNYLLGAATLLLAGTVLGLGLSAGLGWQREVAATDHQLAAVTNTAPVPESPFVAVVERSSPAVVFIEVQRRAGGGGGGGDADDFMRRFFGDGNRQRRETVPSTGSGFIVDKQGRVLTNNHVVRDAQEIRVTLEDRRSFKAKVVGADPETDVAVLQLEGASNLPTIPLGDSDRIRVGDWAIAIGNPLGELRGSVTVGIISAQGRNNLNIFGGTPAYQDFIQTDASINFGNSGGPLCNIRGEVIGINTAVNTSGQGIGFAIPINLAKHVADQLVASGKVRRSMMGVVLAPMTSDIAEGFGLANVEGVLVQQVQPGSPAEKAGIRRNDVIVEYEGAAVNDVQRLRLRVADSPTGRPVRMVVMRDGKRMPLTLTLTERDPNALAGNTPPPADDRVEIGLTVRGLTADEKTRLSVQSGVRVTAVEDGSTAADRGLQVDDVIEEVNRTPVEDAASFARAVREAREAGKPAVLLVNSNGNTRFVPIRLER
jgi:Do/DeqQ family serine protease